MKKTLCAIAFALIALVLTVGESYAQFNSKEITTSYIKKGPGPYKHVCNHYCEIDIPDCCGGIRKIVSQVVVCWDPGILQCVPVPLSFVYPPSPADVSTVNSNVASGVYQGRFVSSGLTASWSYPNAAIGGTGDSHETYTESRP